MSLLPYILGELRDLSGSDVFASAAPRRHHHFHPYRRWADVDVDLDDVLLDDSRPTLLRLLSDDSPRYLVARPRKRRAGALDKKAVAVKKTADDRHALAIDLDVQQFRPEELSVQVLKDQGVVVIEGHHEERHEHPDEHGFVRHHFSRRFKVPDGVDPDTITSRLTVDGTLQVTAPRKEALPAPKETNVRNVPIAHPEKAALAALAQGTAKQTEKASEDTPDSEIQKVD
ncbi:alpha-crystallin B chain-like [Thrips palmi]|uniref:Alpha-crystallin B chain-like n=1 Tax=Thrips palmi TaxID=161013 RepID=A0A6P9AIC7_THRPL|nr:alpha-crystallin B chain-like [Thrips palmi]